MTVHIEFYGIPRARAGVASIDVDATTLGEALDAAARAAPAFAAACLDSGGRLLPNSIANVNGAAFVRSRSTLLEPGDSLLILSADAGG